MTQDMWEFLIIWFILMLVIMRIMVGIVNKLILNLREIASTMFKGKNMPKLGDAMGLIAQQVAPSLGKVISGKIEAWGKGGQ